MRKRIRIIMTVVAAAASITGAVFYTAKFGRKKFHKVIR